MDVSHVGTVLTKVGNEYKILNTTINRTSIFLNDKVFIKGLD
tara:strand:- start:680 stop:805 length:126 start_codon:yes stop_codon:yes gene_type:complete